MLYNDITSHIDTNPWTPRECNRFSKSDASLAGWHRFVRQVKHNSRYVFSLLNYKSAPYEDRYIPFPSQILGHIHRYIKKANVIQKLKKNDNFYRVRVCYDNEKVNNNAYDLGAPISKCVKFSNRMSPAGIPMFYGSQEKETALHEVLSIKHKRKIQCIKIAKFTLLKNISIVDFTKRHEFCLFDENMDDRILNAKAFLNNFIREISTPIIKDGREHVEYVPSQIVTEYLKYKCLDSRGKRIKGILYPNSKGKGVSCVLFFRNRHCVDKRVDTKKAYLQLSSVETLDLASAKKIIKK